MLGTISRVSQKLITFSTTEIHPESWVPWHKPIIPTTQEAEAGRRKFQTNLGNLARPSSNLVRPCLRIKILKKIKGLGT